MYTSFQTFIDTVMFLFHSPSLMLVCGGSNSGKTEFITKLLHKPWLYETPFTSVLYCHGTDDIEGLPQGPGIHHHAGLPDSETIAMYTERNPGSFLLVLDDLQTHIRMNSELLVKLAVIDIHHSNYSCICTLHDLFELPKICRESSQYVVFLRTLAMSRSVQTYGRQLFTGKDYKCFTQSYDDAMREPFAHFVINNHSRSVPTVRLMSDIFSSYPIVYTPRK